MYFKRSLSLGFLSLSVIASAWNGTGHQQIADIAWAKLTHNSKVEIAKILASGDTVSRGERSNSYTVTPPTGGYTDQYLETVVRPVFRRAATWADDIKGGASANYDARIDADNAASPGLHIPEGDVKRARGEDTRCKTWHYYDEPINAPGDNTPHPARPSNAVYALGIVRPDFAKQELAASPDRKEQLYDLFWIEHLFGDLTMPLHCSESYVYNAQGDAGGNRFMTMAPNDYRPGEPENLHSYWDSGIDHAIAADSSLGKGAGFEKVTETWLKDGSDAPTRAETENLDPMSWVHEGHALAIKFVYDDLKPMTAPDATYNQNQARLCEKLALLGGERLANYLNRVLKSHS